MPRTVSIVIVAAAASWSGCGMGQDASAPPTQSAAPGSAAAPSKLPAPPMDPVEDGVPKRELVSDRRLPPIGPGFVSPDDDDDDLFDWEEDKRGTRRDLPDTDGDGLRDGWEVHGVNGIDLAALGASPLRADVFVEMGWMESPAATRGLRPSQGVLDRITAVFANAPVQNPDGTTGIRLHLVWGVQVAHDPDLAPVHEEFYAIRAQAFPAERSVVFHYMIWADRYDGGSSSGLSMSTPGTDFIVTLGGPFQGGTDDEKVGTFVHELGHNFGLRHGGFDAVNRKPNHLSVMNYNFQHRGVWVDGRRQFGYQPFDLGPLNERALRESAGLGDAAVRGYRTVWIDGSGRRREAPAGGGLDWDGDDEVSTVSTRVDLNRDGKRTQLAATGAEWRRLALASGTIGARVDRDLLFDKARTTVKRGGERELTYEEARAIESELGAP